MAKYKAVLQALTLATIVSQPVWAGEPANRLALASAAFSPGLHDTITLLDQGTQEQTRGRLAPLAIPLAIVATDLALISTFWGIVVPRMSGGGGPCLRCSKVNSRHR